MWAQLVAEKHVPKRHMATVVSIAVGRTADKAAAVRKSAIQLLAALLQFNPYAACTHARTHARTHTRTHRYSDTLILPKFRNKLSVIREDVKLLADELETVVVMA